MMETYLNLSGKSDIVAFEIFKNSIEVKFNSGWIYKYTNIDADASHINRMKELAHEGRGLGSYINSYLSHNYSDKRFDP